MPWHAFMFLGLWVFPLLFFLLGGLLSHTFYCKQNMHVYDQQLIRICSLQDFRSILQILTTGTYYIAKSIDGSLKVHPYLYMSSANI
jgi:hypothetical protein